MSSGRVFLNVTKELKLNPDKTDFLVIRSKVQREIFSKGFPTRLSGAFLEAF